jgi:RNA polymerase sigma-70 factor (ECF subfamily)
MIKRLFFTFLFISIFFSLSLPGGTKVSVEIMPPVVVKTVPQSGDIQVDSALSEIKVTFSKKMMTNKMWSWVKISDETFPQIAGNVYYLKDQKTCVLPVKLQPGKTYIIWINSKRLNSFRDENNNPAVPYLLAFQTKE